MELSVQEMWFRILQGEPVLCGPGLMVGGLGLEVKRSGFKDRGRRSKRRTASLLLAVQEVREMWFRRLQGRPALRVQG